MQAIIERCCGLDVHQETVVACLLVGAPWARPNKEVRTFRTVTRDLEALRDWLWAAGVTADSVTKFGCGEIGRSGSSTSAPVSALSSRVKATLIVSTGIVKLNSILPVWVPGRGRATLFLLMNRSRARRDSKPKIAYTYLP